MFSNLCGCVLCAFCLSTVLCIPILLSRFSSLSSCDVYVWRSPRTRCISSCIYENLQPVYIPAILQPFRSLEMVVTTGLARINLAFQLILDKLHPNPSAECLEQVSDEFSEVHSLLSFVIKC